MYHPRLGEDPQWALYQARENLELTDPPRHSTRPRSRFRAARRGITALTALLLVAASAQADTEPTTPPLPTSITAARAAEHTGTVLIPAPPAGHHVGRGH